MLDRVEPRGVDGDDPDVAREAGPRRRGEVLQPGPDGDHHVGLGGQRVCRGGPDDAERAGVQRVVVRHQGAAGDGLHDRYAVRLRERDGLGSSARVAHASAQHQERTGRRAHCRGGRGKVLAVGSRPGHAVHPGVEERRGEVPLLDLHVLGQGERDRAGVGGVGEDPCDLRQRGQQLLGPGDPVEVARDRPERVVDRRRRVAEVLDLLEHRIGRPAGEGVTGEEQHREPVGVRDAGCGHHVERARADGRRRGHHLAAVCRPRVGHRGQCHALLVLAAPGRQGVACLVQRGAEPQHVAVAEDREDTGEQRHLGPVEQLRALRGHPAHQCLRHGQAYGRLGHRGSSRPAAEVIGQRGSVGMVSQVSRTQPCAGSSQNASSRSAPGPAITLR